MEREAAGSVSSPEGGESPVALAARPAQYAPPAGVYVDRRGSGCWGALLAFIRTIFLILISAVLGAALALGALYYLNGTLSAGSQPSLAELQQRLARQEESQNLVRGDLQTQTTRLYQDVDRLNADVAGLQQDMREVLTRTNTAENDLKQIRDQTRVLEQQQSTTGDHLETVSQRADRALQQMEAAGKAAAVAEARTARFDAVLTALRDVLILSQGAPTTTLGVPVAPPVGLTPAAATSTPISATVVIATPTLPATAAVTVTNTPPILGTPVPVITGTIPGPAAPITATGPVSPVLPVIGSPTKTQ